MCFCELVLLIRTFWPTFTSKKLITRTTAYNIIIYKYRFLASAIHSNIVSFILYNDCLYRNIPDTRRIDQPATASDNYYFHIIIIHIIHTHMDTHTRFPDVTRIYRLLYTFPNKLRVKILIVQQQQLVPVSYNIIQYTK